MEIPVKASYTFEDYEHLPEGAPYEFIEGQLIMSPYPTPQHQIITKHLLVGLNHYTQEHAIGIVIQSPIGVKLSETTVLEPDILFIAEHRCEIIGDKYIEGAPDLVVEVLSPSNAYYDLRKKKRLYEQFGVREYWIVDPEEQSVEVYILQEAAYQLMENNPKDEVVFSQVIEGLEIRLSDIFKSW